MLKIQQRGDGADEGDDEAIHSDRSVRVVGVIVLGASSLSMLALHALQDVAFESFHRPVQSKPLSNLLRESSVDVLAFIEQRAADEGLLLLRAYDEAIRAIDADIAAALSATAAADGDGEIGVESPCLLECLEDSRRVLEAERTCLFFLDL